MRRAANYLDQDKRMVEALMSEVALLDEMRRNFVKGFQPTGDPKVDAPAFNALIDKFNAERFDLWDTLRKKGDKWDNRHVDCEYNP